MAVGVLVAGALLTACTRDGRELRPATEPLPAPATTSAPSTLFLDGLTELTLSGSGP